MFKFMLTAAVVVAASIPMNPGTFKSDQQRYQRVREAYAEKETDLKELFTSKKVEWGNHEVFIRAFKSEKIMQLFARTRGSSKYTWIRNYNFCMLSGEVGPKSRQGDEQVPEGFYHIDRFNPVSSFHLSLGINYPNAADRKRSSATDLGGDIFIHGSCVSIGCIPITDEKIKEVYIACVEAKDDGQSKIPVHIFPYRMSDPAMANIDAETRKANKTLWDNLAEGYWSFEKHQDVPTVRVNTAGQYTFSQ